MRKIIALVAFAVALAVPALAGTSVSVGVNVGGAPPPPAIVWHRAPTLTVLQTSGVWYYAGPGDYDYFRYGYNYYVFNNGYWYRGNHWNGPFVVIQERAVPVVFYSLHDRGYHWRHDWKRVPPGHAKRYVVERETGHKRGHGKAKGRD